VFYFSVVCALGGAVTLPFAWYAPSSLELAQFVLLGVLGGIGHILLTQSYRYASASFIAPFDYSTMIWALLLGYWFFGEVPGTLVLIGAAIVIASGLFVIWRERQLGLRHQEPEDPTTPT
jgi:drug/metabolite transporter (DMT)-like permease